MFGKIVNESASYFVVVLFKTEKFSSKIKINIRKIYKKGENRALQKYFEYDCELELAL